MPESAPSRGRPAAGPKPSAPARDTSRTAPQVRVSYYRRMRPHKVYPFVVSLAGGAAAAPVTLRLVVGGAQVVPFEQTLEPGNPDARATFYVTPLAKGQLRGERLEVLQGGAKVQEIRLPCKVTTQRLTWVLLLLTVLVARWIVPLFDPDFNPDMMVRQPAANPELADEEQPRWYRSSEAVAQRIERHLPETLPTVRKHLPVVADNLENFSITVGRMYTFLFYDLVKAKGIPLG